MPDLALFFFPMREILDGDDWKYAPEPPRTITILSRAQMQEIIDADYAHGRISLQEWRDLTNTLSEPQRAKATATR